ncbi:extracellular solute-binding protein [Pseudoxanthobacter sp. M-2]|uniref:extracellular solute-binding protein n=1 Tax=Pseudoxanthobacter sp. M-2 TaxID=3078754 RepID=UPI0038FCBAC5
MRRTEAFADTPVRAVLSIRRRVLGLAFLVLAISAMVFAVFLRDYANRAADRAFDRLLAASALSIAGAVQVEDGRVTVELPLASLAMLGAGGDRVFYLVEAPDGAFVTGYPDLAAGRPRAARSEPNFEDLSYRGERVRVATIGRLSSVGGGAGFVSIRVAETRHGREALANEILARAVLPLVALLLVALAVVWFGVRRAFVPLAGIEQELRERAPDDLSPLRLPVPIEVMALVSALNDFMRRLDSSLKTLSGLVADAAHQVRTPLAALRAQAEVALEERDPAKVRERLVRIHRNATATSDLVNQLLMEAIVAHRLETREVAPLTPAVIVDEVRARLDDDDEGRLAVSVAPAARGVTIWGDRLALREMLRNLVENALAYSDDDVEIDVTLASSGRVAVSVADRGDGIADDEKALVLQRFRRGRAGADAPGTGLGLAVAKSVAEAHGGKIMLLDRPGGGLVARVELPCEPTPATRSATAAMATLVLAALLSLAAGSDSLARQTTYPAPEGVDRGGPVLTVAGATDTGHFAHFIRDFQAMRPEVTVVYVEMDTIRLYDAVVAGTLPPSTDVIVSSAADLQVKLANDGFARAHESEATRRLPAWARWRSEVFGFTYEPAVIVYNTALVPEAERPRSHLALTELLEREPERFRGRVGTYDIAQSGVGHLLAMQDAQISSNFWRLARAFGRVDAELGDSSPQILDLVEEGELALGYNVLGSYAFGRVVEGGRLGVVVPEDYTLVLTRTMLIPKSADDIALGGAFIDYALSPRGQAIAAGPSALGAVIPGTPGEFTSERIARAARGVVHPVALGPALLVALDQQRKARGLETWRRLVTEP